MNKNIVKMIAPLIIIFLLVGYYFFISIFLLKLLIPLFVRVLIIIFSLIISGALFFVLYTRIKEIRSGEEDDLSKY